MLKKKNVLIGITGGIAAYKICELVRIFKRNEANVKVVVTPNALEFVTELTLDTLSGEKIYTEQFNTTDRKPEHISLCDWADIFVIAPASANTIGKLANGICDNLLTSLACAFKKKILIAPAMNTGMWENRFVKENINRLKNANFKIIEPDTGFLACGTDGKGRLPSVETIYEEAEKLLSPSDNFLSGKKVLITAGGTRENIDPVRYIGNYSSGKMGLALADKAYEGGADVKLIASFDANKPYEVMNVNSALEMESVVKEHCTWADYIIMAAAVADYRPIEVSDSKIKKENKDELIIKLIKNPDILAELGRIKKDTQKVIGFCAETDDLLKNAKAKIAKKNCDFIVANDVSRKDIGFGSDYNETVVIDKEGSMLKIDRDTKENVAEKILRQVCG